MPAKGAEERWPAQAGAQEFHSTCRRKAAWFVVTSEGRAQRLGLEATGATTMRVMVIVKASEESETGALPSPELLSAMGAYNNELIAAGVMLDGGGLQASAKGARVSIRNGQAAVTDGPFAETKELIAGYWIWQVASLREAIDWARKAPCDGDQPFNLELRPFFEPEDFSEVAAPEQIAQEQDWRAEQARNAPKATA
jgi:hypothetical protein